MPEDSLVRPITCADIGGFQAAVDAVARERRFLRRSEGPSLEGATTFVGDNIASGNPQFVAVAGEQIVGWCDVVRETEASEHHVGELGIGIIASWRGQGIGRRLITATIAAADAAGLLRIALSVHADNHRALTLYRDIGFKQEGLQCRAVKRQDRFVDIILMARLASPDRWETALP